LGVEKAVLGVYERQVGLVVAVGNT